MDAPGEASQVGDCVRQPSLCLRSGTGAARRTEAMDLVVVVHPWASSAGDDVTENFGILQGALPSRTAYPMLFNWRTLAELTGVVIVYPPDGYVIRVLALPVVREDVMRADVHLLSKAQNSALKSNCLWVSMPLPAALGPSPPSQAKFMAEEHAHSTCGIEIMSLEAVNGHSVDLFKAQSRRKSVPYRHGAAGRAGRAAAAAPLENGAWACRVSAGYTRLYEGATGAALFAPAFESPTSALSMSRAGHRLAGVNRALGSAREAILEFFAAQLVFYGGRRAGDG